MGRRTVTYWRTTLRNAGLDPDLIDKKCLDRKEFKKTTRKRIEHIRKWEHEKADRKDGTTRNQKKRAVTLAPYSAPSVQKNAKHPGTESSPQENAQDDPEEFKTCGKCNATIKSLLALRNHQKRCAGNPLPPGNMHYSAQAS